MIRDFDDLANWLVTLGSDFSPSELHGAFSGALSGGARLAAESWLEFALSVIGLDQGLARESGEQQLVGDFVNEQLVALSASEMSFGLFLPDDDYSLSERTEALGGWCRGFLAGFAESQLQLQLQLQRQREGQAIPEQYPEAVQEALKDLTEIAKATYRSSSHQATGDDDFPDEFDDDFDHEDDPLAIDMENTPDGEDLAEGDFMQVSEYVRLAGLTVFTEFGWVEVLGANGGDKPRALH